MSDVAAMEDIPVAVGHFLSTAAVIGTIIGIFPAVAAVAALVWYMIQIWESSTFQHWLRNTRMKRKACRIARLRARAKVIVAELEALELVRSAKAEAKEKVAVAAAEARVDAVKAATDTATTLPPI